MQTFLSNSSISRNSLIKGTVTCDHLLNIFGKVYGSIYSKKVVLRNAIVYGDIHVDEDLVIINSHVYGNIYAQTVAFSGVCSGDIHASRLEFLSDVCLVYGDIFVDTWQVKPTTKLRLKGRLSVTGEVKRFDWEQFDASGLYIYNPAALIPKVVDAELLSTSKNSDYAAVTDIPIESGIGWSADASAVHVPDEILYEPPVQSMEEKTESEDSAYKAKKRTNILVNVVVLLIVIITIILLYMVSMGLI